MYCEYDDRVFLPSLIVTNSSSYHDVYADDDSYEREIDLSLTLNYEFRRLLNLFEDTEMSTTLTDTGISQQVTNEDPSEVTAIVPYVQHNNSSLRNSNEKVLYDDITYPSFYRKLMTDTTLSHEELEENS